MVNFRVLEMCVVNFFTCVTCAKMLNKKITDHEKITQEKDFLTICLIF